MHNTEKSSPKLKILTISTVAITSVVLVELILGFIVGSLAILSDGAHALLDALSTFVLLIATKASLKPPDEEHMYGHEKIESVGGLIGGIILFVTALFLLTQSVSRLFEGKAHLVLEWELAGFIAIGYTFCIDILRVSLLHKAGEESLTVKAGFYHALADLGSTLIALFGFGVATLGFFQADALASLVLSLIISYLSFKIVWSSGLDLSDAIPKKIAEKVRKEILDTKGVYKCENLRVRQAGAKTFVEASVKVSENISLEEAHEIAEKVEENVKNYLGDTAVTIHVEPLKTKVQTENLVKKVATEIEGVNEIHKVVAVSKNGKLYITLHARVNPKISVQKAHEIAEKIEDKIGENISNVENVSVHIEPLKTETRKHLERIDENKIKKTIQKTLKNFPQALRCERILTYIDDKKRYITVDCSFLSQISIENAHKIASQIEKNLKKQFAETIVTVHIEPEKK